MNHKLIAQNLKNNKILNLSKIKEELQKILYKNHKLHKLLLNNLQNKLKKYKIKVLKANDHQLEMAKDQEKEQAHQILME